MTKRGRKTKIYSNDLIDKIIYDFTTKNNIKGKIGYSEIYRYSIGLFENNEIEVKFSEDFWRRAGKQGKEAIDKVNKLYEESLSKKNEKFFEYNVIDTEACINQYFDGSSKNKKQLLLQLIINEKVAHDVFKMASQLEKLKNEIQVLNSEVEKLTEINTKYEKILFSWFKASRRSDVSLINLMNARENNHPIIDLFFKEIFNDPVAAYEKFVVLNEYFNNNDAKQNSKSRLGLLSEKRKKD